MTKQKTHWLQNPNKNYLGHWDLPEGKDLILTIVSAQWEEVKNPITNTSDAKRVLRWQEDYKPFICNETNAQAILKCTKQKYMEDCSGLRVKLFQSQTKVAGTLVDCLRIREVSQEELADKTITSEQCEEIIDLINKAGKTNEDICKIMKVSAISKLPEKAYLKVKKKLLITIGNKNEDTNV